MANVTGNIVLSLDEHPCIVFIGYQVIMFPCKALVIGFLFSFDFSVDSFVWASLTALSTRTFHSNENSTLSSLS
jgi:hypothetical protein